jgi:hypothetical protein
VNVHRDRWSAAHSSSASDALPTPRRPQAYRAPDGSELAPSSKPQPDGTLVKALARAWRWQKLLDEGVYTSVTEISEAESIGKSYVSRILRLALLAPGIVEEILDGHADHPLMLVERPLPASWEEQRARILESKTSLAV